MPAPFAALEARVNTAVFARLSNADALLGGEAVQGIYRAKPTVVLEDASGYAPTFELPSLSVPSDPRGLQLAITGGGTFKVQDWDDDGTGVITLQLEAV